MKLFHVSEEKKIEEFVPRYSDSTKEPVVWAIAEAKLANYLLPRNCPRVCFSANNATSNFPILTLPANFMALCLLSTSEINSTAYV